MKKLVLPLILLFLLKTEAQTPMVIHQRAILVDTHNDILSNELITGLDIGKLQKSGNFDLVRASKGGLDAQVFSIWCGEEYGKGKAFKFANREIDSLYALIARYPNKITLVRNSTELEKAVDNKKFAVMIGGGGRTHDRRPHGLYRQFSQTRYGLFNAHLE